MGAMGRKHEAQNPLRALASPVQNGRMTPHELSAFLADLNGAEETYPFGPEARVFKVAGKVFAVDSPDSPAPTITLKALPENVERLVAGVEGIGPGYHMNKRHWITVDLDGSVPDDHVRELIAESHAIVVHSLPKHIRLGLEG
jgi:predicted DNA-binding protein (MmcQ/YjbR family)